MPSAFGRRIAPTAPFLSLIAPLLSLIAAFLAFAPTSSTLTPNRLAAAPPPAVGEAAKLPATRPAPPITAACFVPTLNGAARGEVERPFPVQEDSQDDRRSGVLIGSQAGIEWRTWPGLQVVRRWDCQLQAVHHLAFSPDGRRVAACGGGPAEWGGVEVLDWPPSDDPPQRVRAGEDVLHQLTWLPDSSGWIAAGGDSRLYRGRVGDIACEPVEGHSRRVLSVAVVGEELVVSGGVDQALRVWRSDSLETLRTLNNHTDAIRDLAVRPATEGPRMVASAGADRTVRLWQPRIGRLVRFARLDSPPLDIDWLPDGSRLVAACEDGRVRVIDPERVEVEQELAGLEGWAYTLVAAPDGRSVLLGGEGGVRRVMLPSRSDRDGR